MHAEVAGDLSLEEAHRIVVDAERRVLEVFPAADILIHADPHGRAEPHGGDFQADDDDHLPIDPWPVDHQPVGHRPA
jgi:divalent metal cation (Fe/Co/Zn/Cd) transporter